MQYMDRTFVKNFDRTPVYQRGMEIWTEEIIRRGEVGDHLRRLFLEQVRLSSCSAALPAASVSTGVRGVPATGACRAPRQARSCPVQLGVRGSGSPDSRVSSRGRS